MKHNISDNPFDFLISNTLFHITNCQENILNILQNNFHPHYCEEDLSSLLGEVDDEEEARDIIYVPMVSFCDLSLSKIKKHLYSYGFYGIGLEKSWGLKNGITPVLYMHERSISHDTFIKIFGDLVRNSTNDTIDENLKNYFYIKNLIKPYQGFLKRKQKNVRFYDEREWRYIPPLKYIEDLTESEYKKRRKKNKDKLNLRVTNAKLTFSPSDVKYIIVEKEEERLHMMNKIEQIKGSLYDYNTLKILSSKIISSQYIIEDN
ncbi:MAG: hypothetical protein JSS63_13460 [Bacteroidetes bacterium]|nr:hypothetical protein [Bacteroidota bacterium]MBX7046114.1 hypothetical protein [Ignavibacteria bacterium]